MPKLVIEEPPLWYCYADEKSFFGWLEAISPVKEVVGKPDGLHVTLSRHPSRNQLMDLIELLYRYELDMKPLAELRTPRNQNWFADPKAYWHGRVFAKRKRSLKRTR